MPYGTLNTGTITPGSGNTLTINEIVDGTAIKDQDNMSSNSATHLATQQSIKAYVDTAATQATTAAQGVGTGNAVTFTTVNTGQGANELYDMNQNVLTTSGVTHDKLTATTGVLFGTDTAAANTLDDYEEGTWSPNGTGVDGSNSAGGYTKIGRTVHFTGYVIIAAEYTGNGSFTSLPFTTNANYKIVGGGNTFYQNQTSGATDSPQWGIFLNASSTIWYTYAGASGVNTALAAGKIMYFSGNYLTA
jgi:hypothetical protein